MKKNKEISPVEDKLIAGSEAKPVGTVGIGYAIGDRSGAKLHHLEKSERTELKKQFANVGLQTLMDLLENY